MRVVSVVTTPNPDALKFTVDVELLKEGSRSFTSLTAAKKDPIATQLFELEGVSSVFYMANFITINKRIDISWGGLEPEVLKVLKTHVPVVDEPETRAESAEQHEPVIPFAQMSPAQQVLTIDKLLDQEVRPGLAGDGGGLEVVGLEGNVLQIHYEGACGTCPSSTSGTLSYIESILKSNLDQNLQVIPV